MDLTRSGGSPAILMIERIQSIDLLWDRTEYGNPVETLGLRTPDEANEIEEVSTNLLFSATFFRVGSELRRERGSPVSGSLRSRIGRVLIGLAYSGAPRRPARY